ncbi:low molecular weight phosphatase family protein [Halovenus salina]|uniref:Low molecular weight phosphatase family protein n=1 Tax=Halovenus salina TaxID=1510225 RepID=A0ABD5W5I6_9EURY|nr:low molecular weight phosphatase family protein [Halovenus salina]
MTQHSNDEPTRIALVCVQNAGRSQMATAFAERERERRDLTDSVEILTGGTRPAESVHDVVVDVMGEVGTDITDKTPREITIAELNACDYVATMGCSTLDIGDVSDEVEVRDWALDDPDGESLERVREIRDEVEDHVVTLFEEATT